jgi:ABC-type amino acid transport system permease subunit
MFALAAGGIVLACTLAAFAFGMFLRTRLPSHHFSDESKDIVKMVLAVLGTLTALVLGLLIASAKTSLERKIVELRHVAAWTIQLDHALAGYGSEARELRNLQRQLVTSQMRDLFRKGGISEQDLREALHGGHGIEIVQQQLLDLTPQNDAQRWYKETALRISRHIAEMRWLAIFDTGRTIHIPFLVILTFWLAAIFMSFGSFAPRNGIVIATVAICAVSVAGAVFLIVEMDQPLAGFVRVPIAPMQTLLDQLNKP